MSSEATNSSGSEYAIEVNGLGKCYQIYDKPSDRLKQMLMRGRKQYYKEFWALKDVSFKIKKGETVGIIGRNGSGKSTLLQMICGTLNPTAGEVKVNGRVAALLELGAGFNPEFSGVENVYMAASLYGLSKEEVDQRFEAIVAFADIGDHIHQPVKTYSSGMYVRLAFAVIANVDADILVIDEALAVGDAVFTQKCMRFLHRFMKDKTLLFVSHDTSTVANLCKQAIWIKSGLIEAFDGSQMIVNLYSEYCMREIYGNQIQFESTNSKNKSNKIIKNQSHIEKETKINYYEDIKNSESWKTGDAEITKVTFNALSKDSGPVLAGGERVELIIEASVNKSLSSPIIGFFVKDRLGQSLFGEHTYTYVSTAVPVSSGDQLSAKFVFVLPYLPNGQYSMTVSIADGDPINNVQHHWIHDAVIIDVNSPKLRYGLVGIPFDDVCLIRKK